MTASAALIGIMALAAYVARGLTGAGSAVIFNSLLIVVVAVTNGLLPLADGLYLLALTEAFASAAMVILRRGHLLLDTFTRRVLIGLVPSTVAFSFLLPHLDTGLLRLPLSIAILIGGVALIRSDAPSISEESAIRWALPTGLVAGVLGGLFGMAGPILFLLIARSAVNPGVFRDRFVAIAIVTTPLRALTLALAGVYTSVRLTQFAVAAPAVLLGLLVGTWLHDKVSPSVFRTTIGILVVVGGATGLVESLSALVT